MKIILTMLVSALTTLITFRILRKYIVLRGYQGPPGPQGPQGPQGISGLPLNKE